MWAGLKEWFTDGKGRADEMAGLAILSMLTFLALEIYAVVVKGQVFDPQAFGIGLGGALSATAAGLGLKAWGERNGGQ